MKHIFIFIHINITVRWVLYVYILSVSLFTSRQRWWQRRRRQHPLIITSNAPDYLFGTPDDGGPFSTLIQVQVHNLKPNVRLSGQQDMVSFCDIHMNIHTNIYMYVKGTKGTYNLFCLLYFTLFTFFTVLFFYLRVRCDATRRSGSSYSRFSEASRAWRDRLYDKDFWRLSIYWTYWNTEHIHSYWIIEDHLLFDVYQITSQR